MKGGRVSDRHTQEATLAVTTDSEIIEFVNLTTATAESPWGSKDHLRRVLTTDAYAYLDPRPELRYLPTGGGGGLVRSEWELFKKRLAQGHSRGPKQSRLMEERHRARLARERERQKLRGIRKVVEEGAAE